MKKIEQVETCVCGEMPIIKVHNCLNGKVEYCAGCPKCGRGDTDFLFTNFTTYQALKAWNNAMKSIKNELKWANKECEE